MGKFTAKQLECLKLMAENGVSYRLSSTVSLTTWFAGETALRYRNCKPLADAGLIAYSGEKQTAPTYRECWHVTEAGLAVLAGM